jgi:hypothetical protein
MRRQPSCVPFSFLSSLIIDMFFISVVLCKVSLAPVLSHLALAFSLPFIPLVAEKIECLQHSALHNLSGEPLVQCSLVHFDDY